MSILQFEQVTLKATVGPVEILKALTFSLNEGDFVALVGPSGAGKTSLLRLMNRLSEASSGTILFEGRDIRQIPVVRLRRQIALVNQESRLLEMTVQEALGYPLRLQGWEAATISEAIAQWSARLKIPTDWMDRTALNLSLGQRQRVAIARSLIATPRVLLLDEPTSSQDVGYSEYLLGLLANLAAEEQLTIVMANHQIDLVSRYASRLWQLQSGTLLSDTPADAVDWVAIRQGIVAAEQAAQAEWD